MQILASVFTLVAIGIHFFIFYLEVFAFGTPKFQQTFKTKNEDHPILRAPFNNLGIYNGAIAIMTLIGLASFFAIPSSCEGWAMGMMTCGLAIMLCAGAYLFITSPDKRRAACIQGLPPLFALIFWIITAILSTSLL